MQNYGKHLVNFSTTDCISRAIAVILLNSLQRVLYGNVVQSNLKEGGQLWP